MMALTICPFCGETTGDWNLTCRQCGKTRQANHELDPQFIARICEPEWPNPHADFSGRIEPETTPTPMVISPTRAYVTAAFLVVIGFVMGLVAPTVFWILEGLARVFHI